MVHKLLQCLTGSVGSILLLYMLCAYLDGLEMIE